MTLSSLIIVLFIFFISALVITRPFLVKQAASGRSSSSLFDSLVAEQERLLSAIEELDLELELNKISPQEHSRSRDLLLAEAAGVLQELDKHQTGKARKAAPARAKAEDDLERMIAQRRVELKSGTSASCPKCGEPIKSTDKFCSHCGENL